MSLATPTPKAWPTSLPNVITVTSPRLVLRTSTLDDSPALCDILSDPQTMVHLKSMLKDYTVAEMDARTIERVERQHRSLQIPLTVFHNDEVIGTSGFRDIDLVKRTAEWGTILRADTQGRGFGQELLWVLLKYAFEELGIESVIIVTAGANVPMRRVVENLGIKQAKPDTLGMPGGPGDTLEEPVCYQTTTSEWPVLKKTLERKLERWIGTL
ncbi:acyl-CoA N-acyltransferase [Geranomyces variabilis]|nr:acyl-CoA N-acyltransferase [Geranomyces variabilis]KAJ3140701.1 hypothetical protein HDU90_008004 [Geranomyces variabilis]